MTPDDELALVKAQLAVAMTGLHIYQGRGNWDYDGTELECALFLPLGNDGIVHVDGWLPAERALAEYDRLEAEAGRKVNGG